MWSDIIGYTGTICLVLGYLPQAIKTIKTRQTDDIAMPTFLMMGMGSLMFVIQGAMLGNIPLVIANFITLVCSVIIFGIKIYNDYFKKKG